MCWKSDRSVCCQHHTCLPAREAGRQGANAGTGVPDRQTVAIEGVLGWKRGYIPVAGVCVPPKG